MQKILSSSHINISAALGTVPKHLSVYKSYKAAEWKTLLKVYSIPLLFEHIPINCLRNLCSLHDLWMLLTQYELRISDLNKILKLAINFMRGYQDIYYRKDPAYLAAYSINIHWLLHIRQCIKDHSPARGFWS